MCKTLVPSIQLRVAAMHQVVPRLPETKEEEEESAKQKVLMSHLTTKPGSISSNNFILVILKVC